MRKLKALVTAEIIREVLEDSLNSRVDFDYDGYYINHEVLPHSDLIDKIKDYDILICEYDTVSSDVLDAASKLKLIVCCRGGVKTVVDLQRAKEKGIIVCNNAGRNAGALSNLVMGFILNLTRNITLTNNLIHSRQLTADVSTKPGEYKDVVWGLNNESPFQMYRGRSIKYMTLGIIGFGSAGMEVARKANMFNMRVIAYDIFSDIKGHPNYVTFVAFEKLLKEADIVSCHCTVGPDSIGMFNKETFAKMRDGAYFINTARGELVVEQDLVDALKSGKLAGAALDVTAREPIPSDSPLIDAPNLLLTPHIAGSSDDVQVIGTRQVIESIDAFLNGEKPGLAVIYP